MGTQGDFNCTGCNKCYKSVCRDTCQQDEFDCPNDCSGGEVCPGSELCCCDQRKLPLIFLSSYFQLNFGCMFAFE